ncbi:ECF transporter S component [Facklamia sp. DSM 111018]|uniref:ECF transporter S component n=1 Tax=Facklamia lactis TaxID=2749967 RepID=A0ABS0LPI3_9LACT|nr:ECF transporter S component [Facklamia lactis]MBG9985917.1 ECF transporter S component [Facklamia lactis]
MKTKKLTTMALLLTLSIIGANIKFLSSIALDSAPAFLASMLMSPIAGFWVGSLGHFATALTSGFPMGGIAHIVIMFNMGITMYLFGKCYHMEQFTQVIRTLLAVAIGLLINVGLSLLCMIPIIGWGVVVTLFVPLTVASLANIFLAILMYQFMGKMRR